MDHPHAQLARLSHLTRLHHWLAVWTIVCAACGTAATGTTSAGTTADAVADTVWGDAGDATGDGAQTADTGGPSLLTARSLQFTDDMNAVWGAGADDVWWVGSAGRVLHWNGSTLSPRDPGVTVDLYGVGGRNGAEVYVVGDGVILRWDGATWHTETPQTPTLLRSVHVPDDGSTVMAAGDGGVVLRRSDAGTWTPEDTGSKLNIHAIHVQSVGQAWAVGDQGRALKLAGGAWSETDMPGANSRVLRAITASPQGRLFACGDGGYLAATDETKTWVKTLANDGDTPRDLRGLWARSSTDAWAIGSHGALLHLDGKKWQVESIAGTYMKTASFLGLFGGATADGQPFGYAVGVAGAGLTFLPGQPDAADAAARDDRWLDFRAETAADLLAIHAGDDTALVTCGTAGVVLQASSPDGVFVDLAAPVTGADVPDCALIGGTAWIVTAGGYVGQGTATGGWSLEALHPNKPLTGLARLGGSGLLAVGSGGFAASYDGTWHPETTGVQFDLRSVAVTGDVAYAVGKFGVALRRAADGAWTKETTGNLGTLARVVAWGDGEAAAVSEEGVLLVRGAGATGTWKQASETPGQLLYGITRRADGLLIAVGYAGTLITGQPAGPFATHLKNVPNLLNHVACTSKGCLAVGQKGGIFHVAESLP